MSMDSYFIDEPDENTNNQLIKMNKNNNKKMLDTIQGYQQESGGSDSDNKELEYIID